MSHHDGGWRPKGATETYNGFEVWDHGIHACEVNCGNTEAGDDHDHEE